MSTPISMSKQTSTTSLDSLFSRLDLATMSTSTLSTTPVDQLPPPVPTAADVADLIHSKLQPKTMVLLVGLPASGKSTVCKQLAEFVRANGYKALVYNAGNIRRMMTSLFSDSEFFNPANVAAANQRELFAQMCMDNMLDDFRENRINVGFLDATNTTRARREKMLRRAHELGVAFANMVVLDVSVTDNRLLAYNITNKAFNADYKGRDVAASIADFQRRTEHYFKIYEPVLEEEFALYGDVAYVRIDNGQNVYTRGRLHGITGRLLTTFTANYYKMHGEQYNSAVRSFEWV